MKGYLLKGEIAGQGENQQTPTLHHTMISISVRSRIAYFYPIDKHPQVRFYSYQVHS